MYCKSCGSENDDVARFCSDCGRAITGSSPSIERVASADRGDTPDAVEAPTKANTLIWVAGGVGLVVVLLIAGLLVLGLDAASEIADFSPETEPPASPPSFDNRLPAPENARYIWNHGTIIVSWDASEGAEYYTIYHDDFSDTSCTMASDGSAAFCDELSTNILENSYVHTEPGGDENHYWVTACNRSGCSDIDSDNPAAHVDTRPARPANVQIQFIPNNTPQIQVSWHTVPDAEFYKIYYDDFFSDNCRVSRNGDSSFCDLLASDIRQTSYLHTDPDRDENYYWVVACNSGGCSDVDRENPSVVHDSSASTPAPTASPSPEQSETPTLSDLKAPSSGPANVRYIYRDRHGQVVYSGFAESVRVSWEPVEGADFYEVYARAWMFDDRGPLCDPAYFCRMVITNLKKTTHEFDSPANLISGSDGTNRHWVNACNRSGCSDPVLAVVEDSTPSTTAPTASPSPE